MADATPKMNPPAAPASSAAASAAQAVVGKFKSFAFLTQVGVICAILFILFQFIGTLNVRWWLMLPLAVAGLGLLLRPLTRATGMERLVAMVAFYALLAFFLWRDAQFSHALAASHDAIARWKDAIPSTLMLPK